VESLNEMNSKTYADVGKRWDEKSNSIVNLQGPLPAKTYYKDTDSMSSGSKHQRKKIFDFSDPSQALPLSVKRQEEAIDATDAVN
jgi:hypothetical protein